MDLKPCPFCGSAAEVRQGSYSYNGFWVSCTSCQANVGDRGANLDGEAEGYFDTYDEAAAAWNARAGETNNAE